jgi:D-arabinose 1-dehydrogenase-like Zn-dependent alcohol dehydrogenase
MKALNDCDVQSYSGPDWSISLFDTANSIFFDTQRHKRHSIEILVENETTEEMNNETAQQVKEIGFDYVLLVMGTYVNANKITCVCV